MKELENLYSEYKRLHALANRDLSDVPNECRPGHMTQIRQAINDLPAARTAYVDALLKTVTAVFVQGDPALTPRLQEAVDNDFGVVIDAHKAYRLFSARAIASMDSRLTLFGLNQWSHVMNDMRMWLNNMSLPTRVDIVAPKVVEKVCPTPQDVVDHVRHLVRESNGDGVNLLQVRADIAVAAIENEIVAKGFPIFFVNITEQEIPSFQKEFVNNITITIDEKTLFTDNFSTKTLKKIK